MSTPSAFEYFQCTICNCCQKLKCNNLNKNNDPNTCGQQFNIKTKLYESLKNTAKSNINEHNSKEKKKEISAN
jgi:hypothetical protein